MNIYLQDVPDFNDKTLGINNSCISKTYVFYENRAYNTAHTPLLINSKYKMYVQLHNIEGL